MSSDSQPVEIVPGAVRALNVQGQRRRDRIIERHSGGFDGLIGYVGTETIGAAPTRTFLEGFNTRHPDLSLAEFAMRLASELSSDWVEHALATGLWIFLAGAENGELRFWWLFNGQMEAGHYVNLRPSFRAVNDLDEDAIPRMMREHGLVSKTAVLDRIALFFRNGALEPSALVLDDFTNIIGKLYSGAYPGFCPIASLAEYASFVRMRQEFVKRIFDRAKGIHRGGDPPIGGVVYVRSVSPTGAITSHGKDARRPG